MLQHLAGQDKVERLVRDRERIRILQHQTDTRARSNVGCEVVEGWPSENVRVTSVDVGAADVERAQGARRADGPPGDVAAKAFPHVFD